MTVSERIQALRGAMSAAGCDAYILPSSDPHASEYAPAHFTAWQYFSGFPCENSNLVVTADAAAMWVDGRFYGAADAALAGTGIQSMHMGAQGVPDVTAWLADTLQPGQVLGYCAETMPLGQLRELQAAAGKAGASTRALHLEDQVWTEDRPALPATPAWLLAPEYAGQTAGEKLARLREAMGAHTAALVTRLDSVAWLLNLRAADVADTPYALAFCYVTRTGAALFVDGSRVGEDVRAALAADGVALYGYDEIVPYLAGITEPADVLVDPAALNAALYNALAENPACTVSEGDDPIQMMKAVKNETELACTRRAHIADGAAMVRFQMELERRLAAGETLHESDMEEILCRHRSRDSRFWGKSFGTIAAWGPNAVMMHYAPKKGADAAVERRGFLLVDCGGTYCDGTTDITRTYALGPLTEQEKFWYTLVLRSHIDVAMAVWKEGATGGELDMLARQPIWRQMLNYRCGTGHSVSHVGAVHEGPHSLRPGNRVAFVPGMVITDEPGIYEEGIAGVRIENELVCADAGESAYGRYLKFEPLTWAPIDTTPVLTDRLTAEEVDWLNGYHAAVLEKLSPLLDAEEQAWLAAKCAPIGA